MNTYPNPTATQRFNAAYANLYELYTRSDLVLKMTVTRDTWFPYLIEATNVSYFNFFAPIE